VDVERLSISCNIMFWLAILIWRLLSGISDILGSTRATSNYGLAQKHETNFVWGSAWVNGLHGFLSVAAVCFGFPA
jgi:hypothetical protein